MWFVRLRILAFFLIGSLGTLHAIPAFSEALPDVTTEESTEENKEMVIKVTAKKKTINTHSSSSVTEIVSEEVNKLPMGSETSLARLLTTTSPGVVLGPFGQMFFRGNHGDILYVIDGVQMPDSPSGTFGQIFSPRNIDRMEVITGGVPAEYGWRLGAVLNITTKSGTEKPGGEIELNYGLYNPTDLRQAAQMTSPHVLFGGSNETGNFHYYFGLNYLRTGRGLDTPQPESFTNQNQGGKNPVHDLGEGNSELVKLDWQINNENDLSTTLFHSFNRFQIPNYPAFFGTNYPLFQPGSVDAFGNQGKDNSPAFGYVPFDTNDSQEEHNAYVQVVWKRTFSSRSFIRFAPYYKYSYISVMNDPKNDLASEQFNPNNPAANSPGATQAGISPIDYSRPKSFSQNRHVNNLGLKGDYTIRPHEQHLVKTGFMAQASRAEGFFAVQIDLGSPAATYSDPTTGYFEGVYIQDEYSITKDLTLNAGLRYDATQFRFSGLSPTDSYLQPRIGLSYMVTDSTKVHAFYGKTFQPVPLENLRITSLDSDNHDHPPGEENHPAAKPFDLKAEKADYYEVGVDQQLGAHIASVTVYYKDATNMLDEHQLFRTSITQAHNFARGYAYGFDFSWKGSITPSWSDYFNYSYLMARGQDIEGGYFSGDIPITTGYQYLDHMQKHTANLGVTYSKDHFWWSTQSVFGSGLRTGSDNSVQLPAHITFDTSVGYDFGSPDMRGIRVSFDIVNILDNSYPITIANGFNSSQYFAGRLLFLHFTKYLN